MESDSDEVENICPICSRSFTTIAGVRTHWRIHSNEEIDAAINNKPQTQPPTIDDETGQQELTSVSGNEPSRIANNTSQADKSVQLLDYMRILKSNIRVLKRIPKAGRLCSSQDFTKVLEDVTKEIDCFESWFRLLISHL